MKKRILLASLILSSICGVSFAQTTAPTQDMNQGKHGQMQGTPEERAQHFTKHWTKILSLDDATSQKVYAAALAHSQKAEEIKNSNSTTKQADFKANKANFDAALKSILTPDQFAKIQSAEEHRGGGGNHQNGNENGNTQQIDNGQNR